MEGNQRPEILLVDEIELSARILQNLFRVFQIQNIVIEIQMRPINLLVCGALIGLTDRLLACIHPWG